MAHPSPSPPPNGSGSAGAAASSTTAPAQAAPVSERLSRSVALAYGMPSFAGAAMAIPIAVHLSIFYSDVVLVPLGLIAVGKALARAFDAITDPVMGWLSDRTRTRWGRRRPWIALGAPLASLAFVAMFAPPGSLSSGSAGVWFLCTYVLYYLFHTVYSLAHYGLGPELTLDYKDRVTLFGWERAFTVLGTMFAAVLPGLLQGVFGLEERRSWVVFGVVFALLLTGLYARLVWRVRERPDFALREPNPLVPGVRRVMRNRVFRILLAKYLSGSLTGAIPGTMMPFFTTYVLRPENPQLWISVYLAIYFGAGFLCLPLWIWAARRFGKKPVYLASQVPGATGSFVLFFMGQGDLLATAVVLLWAGTAFSAGMTISPAMQADVIDYDELYTGKRREAQFGALWSIMTKFVVIPSMSIPLAVLAAVGYQPNVEQAETVQFAIRAIFGLAPATTGVLGFAIALLYPISEQVHQRIWEGIDAHRRGQTALDPLTGRPVLPPSRRGVDEATGWFLDHFSPRELRRLLRWGPGSVLATALAWTAVSLAACAVAAVHGWAATADLSREPGFAAVLWIVAGGFALAGLGFHAMRVHAALRLARAPVPPDVVVAHLEVTEALRHRRAVPVLGGS